MTSWGSVGAQIHFNQLNVSRSLYFRVGAHKLSTELRSCVKVKMDVLGSHP